METPGPALLARTTRQVDDLVREEAGRLREGLDAQRQVLREALLRAARRVVNAGDAAAADVVCRSVDVSAAFLARDEDGRAARVELAARVAHDRVRAASQRLADEIRALEGDLAAPLVRTSRRTLGEGLPAVRRIVEESAVAALGGLGPAPEGAALAAATAELDRWVVEARGSARELVDGSLARIREATAAGVAAIEGSVEAVPARVSAAVGTTVPDALREVGEETPLPRGGWWRALLWACATGLALLLVIASTLLAYGVGLAAALGLFGAIVLTGTYAPPVGMGYVAAVIGTLLAAAVTDLLFNVLGDWREGRDDGLLGAAVPVRSSGRLPRTVELGAVLEAFRLAPPRSPEETPAPAAYAPFAFAPAPEPTTDPGLVDAQAHRRTHEALHADVVRDVTTDEEA